MEGTPVVYAWAMPSLTPVVLPWLALLPLLALKRNRQARAWWIWVPLVVLVGVVTCAGSLLDFIPSMPLDMFCESFRALAFGLAAVWLLSFYLGQVPRVVGFLGILLTLAVFSGIAFVVRQDFGDWEWTPGLLVLAFCVGSLALSILLAGLMCRRRYRPTQFSAWLFVWILVAWIVITSPFFLFALSQGLSGGDEVLEFWLMVLGFAVASFLTVLPFLVLSFVNSFFGEQLKIMLRPQPEAPPPIIPASAGS